MKPLIIANWKCNPKTIKEAKRIFSKTSRNVVVCPPFSFIPLLKGLSLGAQNCFYEESGPYTGEVSPSMLKSLGCKYVIVGHSERRRHFKENNDIINKKVRLVLKNKMTPVLCVGETLKEKKRRKSVLRKQLESGLKGVDSKKIIIAYEPVWAIGTSNPCSPEEALKVRLFISSLFSSKVLYGGSVNSSNAKDYLDFDGLLVGGASLKPEEITKIANI